MKRVYNLSEHFLLELTPGFNIDITFDMNVVQYVNPNFSVRTLATSADLMLNAEAETRREATMRHFMIDFYRSE